MRFILGVADLVDRPTRVRMLLSGLGSLALALLDTVAVLLVFPLIQLLVAPDERPAALPLGIDLAGDGTLRAAGILAAVVVTLFILKSTLAIVFLRWNLGFVLDAETVVAGQLFEGRIAAAASAASSRDTAAMQRTLTESLRKVFPEGLAFALPAIADQLVIVLLSSVVLVLAPVEALVAVATFAAAAVAYRKGIHGRTHAASAALHEEQRQSIALSTESLRAAREIALSGSRQVFTTRYTDLRRRVARSQRVIALNEQLPRSFLEICLLVCTASVAAVAFSRRDSATALAVVGTFAAIGFRVLPSLNRVLLAATRARSAQPSLGQIRDDLASAAPTHEPAPPFRPPVRSVCVHDLTVVLPNRADPVLEHVNLELRRGEVLGILGASGAGKTSLVNALLGFVPAAQGEVVIDGDTRVTGPASWGRRAAYVPQEVVVFDASLRQNVAFGSDPDAIDDERVLSALASVHLEGLLDELPDGSTTALGEGGARLSGGQRQRLGIARALYLDADVLVLDESTAGLDFETERRVLATLAELKQDRIIVLVSHHQSVMEFCDRLAVLADGTLVRTGSLVDVDATLQELGLSAALDVDRPALRAPSR